MLSTSGTSGVINSRFLRFGFVESVVASFTMIKHNNIHACVRINISKEIYVIHNTYNVLDGFAGFK